MSQHGPQPDPDPLPLEVEQQIDRLSDEFERAWKTGQPPRIEDYLDRVPEAGRAPLLRELLVVEFELLRQSGDTLDVESYRKRFCDFEAVVDAALGAHERRRWGDGLKPGNDAAGEEPPDPTHIGRFEIRRRLGRGGFGVVYLAHDPGLDRLVAIKVPRGELLKTGQQRESFLHEARTAAKLKHPALVTVHEVQQETDLIYIVQEYIEGQNLAQWAAAQPRSWEEIARRLIEIATAIGYVHQQGFYHRDLKPGNILIDNDGHAHVADFGLAVHENSVRMLKGQAAGTPRYMSPEQIRGETHRIDNRTDIWALGVILYELLAGQRPFTADEPLDLYEEIQELDPKSPRTRNPDVPKELERICFKCLAKRRTHRYATAGDLIEDLEAFLATCGDAARVVGGVQNGTADAASDPVAVGSATMRAASDSTPQETTPTPNSGSQPPLRIVPKGLRSFDKEDKDFYLELLPGPRDREGLPDSIRFWKTRIEEMDADATFPVGVMYGPSGCGKSSLVKAGLLPHLADHVVPVFVEATPNDTELRMLKALRKHLPRLPSDASLAEALAQLREGRVAEGRKVLLVLDQFEQWLHATAKLGSSQLVRALRQCDGANSQCLILVRDDFWMSTTRFMQALEISQLEGINSAAVDLFDPSHARKVLRAFGLAYGRLPQHDLSADQQKFLDRAVQDLTDESRIICVQLALFADMMKTRPWTPASLQEVGGAAGVGVAFLDETFTGRTAPPTHRLHAKAAQAVLKALLPDVGTDIKGQMQPTERLSECSGYANRADDFRDLLRILNAELRLITPTEPEKAEVTETKPAEAADRKCYQLTHDFLVPSLRKWLLRKQTETWQGRAELRLAERSALWNTKRENRQLPKLWEQFNIRIFARRKKWTEPERRMMKRAARVYGVRSVRFIAGAVIFLLVLFAAPLLVWHMSTMQKAHLVIATLKLSTGRAVPAVLSDLRFFGSSSDIILERLRREFDTESLRDAEKLAIVYGLAAFGQVEREVLIDAISSASRDEIDNLVEAFGHDRQHACADLKQAAERASLEQDWILKARLAVIAFNLGDESIACDMLQSRPLSKNDPEAEDNATLRQVGQIKDVLWPSVDDVTRRTLQEAHGSVHGQFAYCLDMPWTSFETISASLQTSGYRPTRVRPFSLDRGLSVSAIWMRDGAPWKLDVDLSAEDISQTCPVVERAGLLPADVAAYSHGEHDIQFALLWSEPYSENEQCYVRVGMTEQEWLTNSGYMREIGAATPKTLQAYVSADGVRRYAAIWSNRGEDVEVNPLCPEPKSGFYDLAWEDISVAPAGKWSNPIDGLREQLISPAVLPKKDFAGRLNQAMCFYFVDEPQKAIEILLELTHETDVSSALQSQAFLFYTLCWARLEKAGMAEQSLTRLSRDSQAHTIGEILTAAWLGELSDAKTVLEKFVGNFGNDADGAFSAAWVAAELARIFKGRESQDIQYLKKRSIELLRKSYELGHPSRIDDLLNFAGLYDDPEFQSLAASGRYCAAIWHKSDRLQSWIDADLSLEGQQEVTDNRVAAGFYLVAVSMNAVSDLSAKRPILVWRRHALPKVSTVQREVFIETAETWRGRSGPWPEANRTTDKRALSGLCLAMGDRNANIWNDEWLWNDHPRVYGDICSLYRNDSDACVHSAAGWALKRLRLRIPELTEKERGRDGQDWRVSNTGMTMLRIRAGKVERSADTDSGVPWRLIRIEQDYWLSDSEVTVDQFMRYLRDPDASLPRSFETIVQHNSGNLSQPIRGVTWYEAVMYCNWLSDQEGLHPCYRISGTEQSKQADGSMCECDAWELVPDGNGYRLPTEDEWEYACRAGTNSRYSCGDEEERLVRYAVYNRNANNGPEDVKGKLCNTWGLFDMHGNVFEWCHDRTEEGTERAIRGGSWAGGAMLCLSAYRYEASPLQRSSALGFRVARSAGGGSQSE